MSGRSRKRVLVLELGRRSLQATEVRRGSGGQCAFRHGLPATLALDPWTADPALVGREIQNLLSAATMKPGACIICLPAEQFLMHSLALPDLSEPDIPGFLALEAERAFPFAPEDLVIATSRAELPGGGRQATLVALLASHARRLDTIARQAGLRLVRITLGATALLKHGLSEPQAVLAVADTGPVLAIAAGGGLLALRALDDTRGAAVEPGSNPATAMRELRITLARLPEPVRRTLTILEVFAFPQLAPALRTSLSIELQSLGLSSRVVGIGSDGSITAADEAQHPPAAALAGQGWINGEPPALEFLAPRVNRMQQLTRRYMARGLMWRVGGAVALVAFLTLLAIGWQSWRLARLEARWAAIQSRVAAAEDLQERIRAYRPWFDDTIQTLTIARALTSTFPENGDVWARSLEMQELLERVVCSGYARSEAAALRVHDELLKTEGVEDLKISQLRGTDPIQFSLSYRWNAGGHHGHAQP